MNEWFLYMNDQKNKWTQDRSILFTSFSCSTSPSLYIVRLPRLLKTAPKVLVETALWSTALGNNQKSPRASSSPDSITGNYKGHRAHSLAGFPFFSQNSIWCLCPINSLAGTSREMARRCFCWLLRTINKKHPFLPRSRPRTFFSTQWKVLHWWSYVTTIGISDQTGKRPSPIFANGGWKEFHQILAIFLQDSWTPVFLNPEPGTLNFVHLTLSASTLYVPGTTQGIRDTKMTQWSPPLIAKPVDVADKKAELRARGKRKTGR